MLKTGTSDSLVQHSTLKEKTLVFSGMSRTVLYISHSTEVPGNTSKFDSHTTELPHQASQSSISTIICYTQSELSKPESLLSTMSSVYRYMQQNISHFNFIQTELRSQRRSIKNDTGVRFEVVMVLCIISITRICMCQTVVYLFLQASVLKSRTRLDWSKLKQSPW